MPRDDRRALKDSLKVLFLTQTFPRTPQDAAGPFIREIACGLERLGDRVRVLAPHASGLPDRWEDRGLEVRTFRYAPERFEVLGYGRSLEADEGVKRGAALVTPLYALAARAALGRELRRARWSGHPYDLVHAHWIVPNGVIAAFSRTMPGTPLAIGLHGSDVFLAERRGVRGVVKRALRRTAVLTGCSPELVDRIVDLGFPRENARVIPYGVDTERFSPGETPGSSEWRRRLGVPAKAPLLGTVGRMATKKGFQHLVAVLPGFLERQPDAHVVLAGEGDRLSAFRSALAPWADRVHLPGLVLQDTLPDLYRALNAFVLPAIHDPQGNVDGLPNVILEAMATGLPVVSSAISGIPLAVEDGRTGRLVREGDETALAGALDEVLSSPALRRAWGDAARAKVERELTWDHVARRYREAYRLVR